MKEETTEQRRTRIQEGFAAKARIQAARRQCRKLLATGIVHLSCGRPKGHDGLCAPRCALLARIEGQG